MSPIRYPSPDVDQALRGLDRLATARRERRDAARRERRVEQRAAEGAGPRHFAFLHVPKSAGSSVDAALRVALADHRWADWSFDDDLFGPYRGLEPPEALADRVLPGPEALRGHDAVAGHFTLPTLLARFDPVDVAVVAREPRSRLVSHYEYWRSLDESTHAAHGSWAYTRTAVDLDLAGWLDEPAIAFQTDNALLRQLIGPDPAIPADGFIPTTAMAGLVRRALTALRPVGWVGLVEQGAGLWSSLSARVGTEVRPERRNVTEGRADRPVEVDVYFTERTTRLLAARTGADALIWRSLARRLHVVDADVVAEVAWAGRLGQSVKAARR